MAVGANKARATSVRGVGDPARDGRVEPLRDAGPDAMAAWVERAFEAGPAGEGRVVLSDGAGRVVVVVGR